MSDQAPATVDVTRLLTDTQAALREVVALTAANAEAIRRLDTEVEKSRDRWHLLNDSVTAMRGEIHENHAGVMGRIDRLVEELNLGRS